MNKLIRLILSALLFPSLAAAAQTSTAATGSKIQDGTGNLITQGTICFSPYNSSGVLTAITPAGGSPSTGPFCYTILNGGWSTFAAPTPLPNLLTASPAGLNYQMVVLSQTGTTVLTVNWVTSISGATATTDNLVVGASLNLAATSSGLGTPYLACAPPASYFSTNNQTGRPNWTCAITNGNPQWFQSGVSPAPGPGQSATVPVVAQMIADAVRGLPGNTPFAATSKLVVNTSPTFSRNATMGDITGFWTATGTGCGNPANVMQLNGNCTAAGGSGTPPAGTPLDVQINLNNTNFGADPGNFTYTVGSHQLSIINQAMTGFFNQVGVDIPTSHKVENDSTGPSDSFGNSLTTASLVNANDWGVGKNNGPCFGCTSAAGWRTILGLDVEMVANAAGIHQGVHINPFVHASGDSAGVYIGNAEGFSPCMWTDSSGEGCVLFNGNGTQNDCIATGTIASTTGPNDRNPVFSITPLNCNGGQALINDGIIIDTSITLLHTALTGTVSTNWETNPFQIGSLAVTPGSAILSTGIGVLTADVPLSTVPGIYQTKAFSSTVHDSLPLTTGIVFVASPGNPERCTVVTVGGSSPQTGTISCAKFHAAGSYIFQGGIQGFADLDDDMSIMGTHSVIFVLGATDTNHLIIAHRQAGAFIGTSIPYVGAEPAGRTLTGGVTVHPGALCVSTNSNNTSCILEVNNVAWANGHGFASPTGLPTLESMVTVASTQTSPDNPQSPGAGMTIDFHSETQHSSGHAFLALGNFASLSKYIGSGVGTGYLSAPPALRATGANGNLAQFDMLLTSGGGYPCSGGTILCYMNSRSSNDSLYLYKNAQGADTIKINHTTSTFDFSWGVTAGGNSTFGGVSAGTLSIQSINPAIPQNNGNFLFNGRNWFGSQAFLNLSSCNTQDCAPGIDGVNGHLSAGALTAGDVWVGARQAVIDNAFPFTSGSTNVCYAAAFVTSIGITAAGPTFCINNSAATPNNFIQAWQGEGAQLVNIYRVSGGATQGLVCANLPPATPTCFDANNTATGSVPTIGNSGILHLDGSIVGPVNIAAVSSGVNGSINFGPNYSKPAITLYDGGVTNRYGWGLNGGEMQFFMGGSPSTNHFSWNTGGDFQPSGTNELMRLFTTGDLSIGTTADCGVLLGIGSGCPFKVNSSGGLTTPSASILASSTNGDIPKFDNTTGHLADSGIPSSTLASTATVNNWSAQQNFQSLAIAQIIVNGNGLQVVTGSGCTTAASLMAPCNVTMTLAVVEPNTAYTVEGCTMNGAAAVLGNVTSLTTTNFVLAEYAATAAAASGGTITCLITHN